jgi:hypothetical protein
LYGSAFAETPYFPAVVVIAAPRFPKGAAAYPMKFAQEGSMQAAMKDRKLGLVLTILVAITVIVGASWYVSKIPEREAERVIRSLRTVQLGKTRVEEVIDATPGVWTTGTSRDFRSSFSLILRNDPLRHLKLAPVAGVMVHIGADKGIIDEIQIFWEIGESGNTAEVRFFQVANHEPECGQDVCVKRRNGQNGRPWWIQIDASPAASAVERNKFLDFNTSCLSKIGGCKDAGELLPHL